MVMAVQRHTEAQLQRGPGSWRSSLGVPWRSGVAIENCHGHNGHIYNQPLDLHPSPFGTRIPMAKKAPELRCVAKQKARMCFDEGHSCPPLPWKV